jgi:hypothetical protein
MRVLPIDTTSLAFVCATAPEPVVDFESRRPKTDTNGIPLYGIRTLVMVEGGAEVIQIKVPGEPTGIAPGQPVRPIRLIGIPWDNDGKHGIAYRADSLQPAAAPSGPSREGAAKP